MGLDELHSWVVMAVAVLAVFTFVPLVFIKAPYGRYRRPGWGPTTSSRTGWILMESPAVWLFVGFFAMGRNATDPVSLVLAGFWLLHYVNRGIIYPFRLRADGKRMPLLISLLGFVFNTANAWINAWWIGHLGLYDIAWLMDPRFAVGSVLFIGAFVGNMRADQVLRSLRQPGDSGYQVPHGGMYRWISCPNYLCELLEWVGWAILTWSSAGVVFAIYTAANLVPRAMAHHNWYQEQFSAYPKARKALVPFVL